MTDLKARIGAANPISEDDLSEDDLTPSLNAVWLAVEAEGVPTRRSPRTRYMRSVMATPRGWVALAGTTSAAVVAVLVFSAGTSPAPAQAFPILRTHGTDISKNPRLRHSPIGWPGSAESFFQALKTAHSFPIMDGNGYVLASPDGNTMCLVLLTQEQTTSGSVGGVQTTSRYVVSLGQACNPTSNVEQNGLIASVPYFDGPIIPPRVVAPGSAPVVTAPVPPNTSDFEFAVLVPTGGTVDLTDDGTTTPVSISNGIATGIVHEPGTVTVTVGGVTQTKQFPGVAEPSNPTSSTTPAPASGATSATGATGSPTGPTGASGPTAASGTTGASGSTGTT